MSIRAKGTSAGSGRGVATAELVAALPFLVAGVLAVVQFGGLLSRHLVERE